MDGTSGAPIPTQGRDPPGLMAEVRAFLVAHVGEAPGAAAGRPR